MVLRINIFIVARYNSLFIMIIIIIIIKYAAIHINTHAWHVGWSDLSSNTNPCQFRIPKSDVCKFENETFWDSVFLTFPCLESIASNLYWRLNLISWGARLMDRAFFVTRGRNVLISQLLSSASIHGLKFWGIQSEMLRFQIEWISFVIKCFVILKPHNKLWHIWGA